ncbi:hypothetical protein TEK04_19485 [Klenkia sp. LSe6-5]|uniref:Uncharacterized protein n=1 Tax=Klenkia sesuvii TaxID=3103137 RepID=A0ABU8DYK1_9ACTN
MLTISEHQQIARDLLVAVHHADEPGIETALRRLFGPGTDERDGYVIASGLIGGIAGIIRPRGGAHPPVRLSNEARSWPDWRTADPSKAIEHDRSGEAPQ